MNKTDKILIKTIVDLTDARGFLNTEFKKTNDKFYKDSSSETLSTILVLEDVLIESIGKDKMHAEIKNYTLERGGK